MELTFLCLLHEARLLHKRYELSHAGNLIRFARFLLVTMTILGTGLPGRLRSSWDITM